MAFTYKFDDVSYAEFRVILKFNNNFSVYCQYANIKFTPSENLPIIKPNIEAVSSLTSSTFEQREDTQKDFCFQ